MARKVKRIPRAQFLSDEFERIRVAHDGALSARDVVREAAPAASRLHKYFTWNNIKAADEYRLWQARQLIAEVVVIIPKSKVAMRHYVSVMSDRKDAIYRTVEDVMSNKDYREQLLAQALDDLEYWQQKYGQFSELAVIYEAIEKTRKNRGQQKPVVSSRKATEDELPQNLKNSSKRKK